MESLLTKEELLAAVKGTQIGSAPCSFNDVQTDSRNVSADKPCMFVPLIGEFQNGHKYIPDDTLVLLPDGALGSTCMGTTPEESDLMASGIADVRVLNSGITVTGYKTVDPVNVEMKVSMVGLPSFERANEIVILDTNATQSA